MNIVFLGRESGLILKEKMERAGFHIVDPESSDVDLIVVGFYGKILPKKLLEIPKHGVLNVHPSLLPKYRGATPIQNTIMNGETTTGVTIILMDEKVDHGPIVATEKFEIGTKRFTAPELTKELWELGGDLLVQIIPEWVAGAITPIPQDHAKATYTKLFTRQDGKIDWKNPALYIERQVRGLFPWPGTFTSFQSKLVKILKAEVSPLQGTPGTVFKDPEGKLGVYTGEGALLIQKLQPEGKTPMTGKEFLLGYKNIINQTFQ
ncbi:MAG: methionyl-tRNA formyltransferase [bacterium]|nr:methionyl-tRNA formyltransferase [bacterium]